MKKSKVTRRVFLGVASTVGMAALTGCPFCMKNGKIAYRRSGRGLHVSNAAKKHNANRLYATREAALADLAHPGDKSKVVMVTINRDVYNRLFPEGVVSADLRRDL